MPSLTTETGELRDNRLQAAALFLAIGYGVFLVFGLLDARAIPGLSRPEPRLPRSALRRGAGCWQARSS